MDPVFEFRRERRDEQFASDRELDYKTHSWKPEKLKSADPISTHSSGQNKDKYVTTGKRQTGSVQKQECYE